VNVTINITSWCTVPLEKLTVPQPFKKFAAVYATRMSIVHVLSQINSGHALSPYSLNPFYLDET
jgi:hypothetical protein